MKTKMSVLSAVFLMSSMSAAYADTFSPAGFEGYVYEEPRVVGQGGYVGTLKGPQDWGFSMLNLKVINIDMRPQTYNEEFELMTSDDLKVTFAVHVILSVRAGTVKDVVEKYGAEKWYEKNFQARVRTLVRESVKDYSSRNLKDSGIRIEETVKAELIAYLKDTPFVFVGINAGNFSYPVSVSQAVERKLAAQQQLEQKESERLMAEKDAQIRIIEAKGIAESQKIIQSTLTKQYLQHEAIKAQEKMLQSSNHTVIYMPTGPSGIPIVDTVEKDAKKD